MRNKKNPKVDLERRKPGFFLTGLILAIGGVLAVINLEWTQNEVLVSLPDHTEDPIIEVLPPVTRTAPKAREHTAVVTEKILIAEIIPALEKEKEIVLDVPDDDPFSEIGDPDDVTVDIIDIEVAEEEVLDFVAIEKYPTFSECGDIYSKEEQKKCFERGILKHISSNFRYPEFEKEMGMEERLFVQFVITKTGDIDQVEVVKGNMKGFIKESKRLINTLPKVKPAEQRGEPVNLRYTIPIRFRLK